jgi:hypothetical protein
MLASYTLVLTTTIALTASSRTLTRATGYVSQDLVPNEDQSFALVWFSILACYVLRTCQKCHFGILDLRARAVWMDEDLAIDLATIDSWFACGDGRLVYDVQDSSLLQSAGWDVSGDRYRGGKDSRSQVLLCPRSGTFFFDKSLTPRSRDLLTTFDRQGGPCHLHCVSHLDKMCGEEATLKSRLQVGIQFGWVSKW